MIYAKPVKSLLVAAALSSMLAVSASAAPGGGPHRAHFGGGFNLLRGVTLTSEQQTQVKQIRQASWTQIKPVVQQLHSVRQQIEAQLLSASAVNTGTLTTLEGQEAQLAQELQTQRLNTTLQIRALLTSAQLAQAAATYQQLAALHSQERALLSTMPQ